MGRRAVARPSFDEPVDEEPRLTWMGQYMVDHRAKKRAKADARRLALKALGSGRSTQETAEFHKLAAKHAKALKAEREEEQWRDEQARIPRAQRQRRAIESSKAVAAELRKILDREAEKEQQPKGSKK